jgi:plasmid stability protein
LDDQTIKRLKERAKRHGRSLQREAKSVLELAAGLTLDEALQNARQWRKKLGRRFDDSVESIREDRNRS